MDKKIFVAVTVLAVAIGGLSYWAYHQPDKKTGGAVAEVPAGVTYFFGQECPHCHDVLKFLDENRIAEKVQFEKREVWHDKSNQQAMVAAARSCGLDENKIGVPFLFAEGRCYIGTPDVEGYFKQAAGIR